MVESHDVTHAIARGNVDEQKKSVHEAPGASNADFLYNGDLSDVGTINITGASTRVLMLNYNLIYNNATVNVLNDSTFDFGGGNATITLAISEAKASAAKPAQTTRRSRA